MHHPHDAFFRFVFEDPAHAADELRAVLPTRLADAIDWPSLRHLPGSFVDEELRRLHTDLLFEARLLGRPGLLYVLFEHQSSDERFLAIRLWRYVGEVWASLLRGDDPPAQLPVVLPVVLYAGLRPFRSPTSIGPLLAVDPVFAEQLGPLLPHFAFELDDLARIDESELRARALGRVSEIGLSALREVRRHGDQANTLRAIARWGEALREVLLAPNGPAVIEALARYLLYSTETEREALIAAFAQLGPGLEALMKSTGERMDEAAEARGRAEGEVRGRAELLLKLLRFKFGPVSAELEAKVRAADVATQDRWAEAVLRADTLEQALR